MNPTERRNARKAERTAITRAVNERGFSAAEERWFDLIAEGVQPLDAAKQAGLTQKSVRARLMTASCLAEINRRVVAVRTAEGPRNLHVARTVRDRALDPESSAAQQRVSLDAARFLEGDSARPGTSIQIGVRIGPALIKGLVVDLSDDEPEPLMIDVTPSRAPAPLPAHLAGRVDLGDDEPEEAAPEPRPFVAVPQTAINPFATDGGFKGRANYPDRSAPVQTRRYRTKPRV